MIGTFMEAWASPADDEMSRRGIIEKLTTSYR